eukprot:6358258-Alexandrium_andersonii.AAC.1
MAPRVKCGHPRQRDSKAHVPSFAEACGLLSVVRRACYEHVARGHATRIKATRRPCHYRRLAPWARADTLSEGSFVLAHSRVR